MAKWETGTSRCSALVFVDVDGMSRVNATLGHSAGD